MMIIEKNGTCECGEVGDLIPVLFDDGDPDFARSANICRDCVDSYRRDPAFKVQVLSDGSVIVEGF